MTTHTLSLCTAFAGHQCIAAGTYVDVAESLVAQALPAGSFLVFDDATGTQVDYPWPAGHAPHPPQAESDDEPPATPSVGRPKLGVVAREVTLCHVIGSGSASSVVVRRLPCAGWWMKRVWLMPALINCARPRRPAIAS